MGSVWCCSCSYARPASQHRSASHHPRAKRYSGRRRLHTRQVWVGSRVLCTHCLSSAHKHLPSPHVLLAAAQGPRGFTSAAAFEAAARHKQHLEEMAHRDTGDEGSLIVDTTTAAAAGGAHNLQPARTLDEHSLQGKNAPHFVGDQLVDAPDFDTAAAGGSQVGQAGSAAATNTAGSSFDKTHPHGVYSLVSDAVWCVCCGREGMSCC